MYKRHYLDIWKSITYTSKAAFDLFYRNWKKNNYVKINIKALVVKHSIKGNMKKFARQLLTLTILYYFKEMTKTVKELVK